MPGTQSNSLASVDRLSYWREELVQVLKWQKCKQAKLMILREADRGQSNLSFLRIRSSAFNRINMRCGFPYRSKWLLMAFDWTIIQHVTSCGCAFSWFHSSDDILQMFPLVV